MSFSYLTRSLAAPLLLAVTTSALAQAPAPESQAPTGEDMQAALQELAGMSIRCASMYQQMAVAADDGSLQAAGFDSPQASAYQAQREFWRNFLLYLTASDPSELDPVLSQGSASFGEFINGLADPELPDRDALRMQLSGFLNQCAQVRGNVVEPLLASDPQAPQPE